MPEAVAALQPMAPKELALRLEAALALWQMPENFSAISQFYVMALREMPADLAEKAINHVALNHKYPTMPKPADFRAAVAGELGERQRVLGKLELAIVRARRDDVWKAPAGPRSADAERVVKVTAGAISGAR